MVDRNVHTIRLWGPWQLQFDQEQEPSAQSFRCNLRSLDAAQPPWSVETANRFSGRLLLSRKFNQPTGLARIQKIYLEVDWLSELLPTRITLNQDVELTKITAPGSWKLPLELQAGFNVLEMNCEIPKGALVGFAWPPFSRMQICIEG